MATFNLNEAQLRDRYLPTNAFTVGYVDLIPFVVLSLDKGPDPVRPREPSVLVGPDFITRDRFVDREKGPLGCVYHTASALVATVYRAVVHTVTPHERKPFSVLRTPAAEVPLTSLVKVSLTLPRGHKVKPVLGVDQKDHALRVWSGIHTTGMPILVGGGEYLLELGDGEQVTLFFEDGFVRQFRQEHSAFVEIELTTFDMLQLRIEDAQGRLAKITPANWPAVELREKALQFILSGMVDLIHLAAKDEVLCKELVQFFFNLPQSQLALVHRKLTAVLHQRDPISAHAFSRQAGTSTVVPMKPGIDPAAAAHKRAQVEARRDVLNLEAQRKKGPSGGGGKQKSGKNKK